MKKIFLTVFLIAIYQITIQAQAVYVDSNIGNDNNPGTKEAPFYSIGKAAGILHSTENEIYTIKINPGIYILDNHISVSTEKEITDKRIIIEASILPDDKDWTPEKMPVITSKALKGGIPENAHFVNCFRIDESHVTIRGLKFHGYFYPHTRSCPIGRFDKTLTDLLVEQCVFVGEPNSSQLHVGIYADGNEVVVDHCIFFKVRNTVVFGKARGNGITTGNGITNTIVYGASQGLWTSTPDKDFSFENNIVSNCRYFWVKGRGNSTKYSMKNCIIVNNKFYTGIPDEIQLNPAEFEIDEHNIIKTGEISISLTGIDDRPTLNCVDLPLPVYYMHISPNSLGYNLGAGLFKNKNY